MITETIYNAKGQVEKSIIRFGNEERVTSYKYDEFGNINETTQPDGTKISAKYNEKGQKVSETNQLGQTRSFEYGDNGQLIKVKLPEVNGQKPVYEYTYNAQGNQLTIKDPNGHITRFVYDINGNQTERMLPDESKETFEYDPRGRIVKETSFEDITTTYKYDNYDRLESKTFLDKNGNTETWSYTYDEKSGRVWIIDQAGRITTTLYDEQGRTKSIETPEGKILYEYDKFGRQTSVKTDDDKPIYYTYDSYGRLLTVRNENQTTTYEYDTFGNLSKTITDTGSEHLIATYVYDTLNRLIKLTNFVDVNEDGILNAGDDRISEFLYLLDNLGRKDYAVEKFWTEYGEQKNEIDWEYDVAGRLVYENFDHYIDAFDQTSEWLYDLVGNRLKQVVNGTETKYSYDSNDRLLNEVTGNKSTLYRYDHTQQTGKKVSENGTLISETTFTYDLQGRISVVAITTGNRVEKTVYEYGADGIRVSAEQEIYENNALVSKTRTEYLNDPLNITGYSQVLKQTETDVITGEETVTNYVIGHQRISKIVTDKDSNQQEYYFTFDGHGSTRALTDFAGAIAQLYAFDAYGNAIGFNLADALTEFLYSGEQFDSKIGQQYLRARYYDPATGRFNRLDPFFGNTSDPQSFHKYLYAHGDPVNGVDPSGNMAIMVSLGSFMSSLQMRLVNVTNTLDRAARVTTQVYRTIIQISMLANEVQAMMDQKLYPFITFASAYQAKMLLEFSKISTNKLKSQIVSRILKIGSLAANNVASNELASALNYHVPIKPTGFPDFSNYLYQGFKPVVFITLTGSRSKDIKLANAARGSLKTPAGYIWHHHEVMGIMLLVRTDVYATFFGGRLSHVGGAFYYTIVKNIDNYGR